MYSILQCKKEELNIQNLVDTSLIFHLADFLIVICKETFFFVAFAVDKKNVLKKKLLKVFFKHILFVNSKSNKKKFLYKWLSETLLFLKAMYSILQCKKEELNIQNLVDTSLIFHLADFCYFFYLFKVVNKVIFAMLPKNWFKMGCRKCKDRCYPIFYLPHVWLLFSGNGWSGSVC